MLSSAKPLINIRFKRILKDFLITSLLCFVLSSGTNAAVVSSIKPIGFITAAIADGAVNTQILVPDGASPHDYALKPSDLNKIRQADLIIWIGKDMETFLPNVVKQIEPQKQLVLTEVPAMAELLYHPKEAAHGHEHVNYDPHIWLSPEIAKAIAGAIHDRLVKIYPAQKLTFDKNLLTFIKVLNQTEQTVAKKLNSVQNMGYFVFHDAYGYFERHFGLNNLGHFTLNPTIQPGAKRIYQIQQQIKDKQAVCIFSEPQFSPAIIDKVISGIKIKHGELDPLGMNIPVTKDAYINFITSLSSQFEDCLAKVKTD